MTITIGPNTYVACIVFIASNTQDIMGGLIKESVLSKEWTFHYRVRYYKSGTASTTDPFSDEDEKRSYIARQSCTEAEAMAMIKEFVRDMIRTAMPDAHTVEIVPVNGGIDAWYAALKDKPWAHFKREDMPGKDAVALK